MNQEGVIAQRSNFTIYILEDDPTIADGISDLLTIWGYKSRCFLVPLDFMTVVTTETPDLVFLDITLPQIDGFEVLRRLRTHPNTKALPVFLSAAMPIGEIWSKSTHHFEAFVQRPFRSDKLLNLLDDFLVHDNQKQVAFSQLQNLIHNQNMRIDKLEKQIANLADSDM